MTYAQPSKAQPPKPQLGKPTPVRAWTASNPPAEAASSRSAPIPSASLPQAASYPVALASGRWTPLGGSGIWVKTGSAVRSVRVQVLDRATALRYGQSGLALHVTRADHGKSAGAISVRIPERILEGLYGADFAARARWVAAPAGRPAAARPVASARDTSAQTVSAVVGAQPMVLAAAGAPTPSNGTGTWAATSLSPAASWDVSAQTGGFSWSEPLRVPPAPAGPAPSLALSYNSGSVDGQTGSTNNQASAIGEGWSVSGGGFIERSYAACSDDGVASSGDLCWKGDNATVAFGGHSGVLVHGSGNEWRLQADDATRVQKLTGVSNGGHEGDYWMLTTMDGTRYYFGRGANSAWTVPVFGNNDGEPCHASTFAASACPQVWRWNLDYVVDAHGNAERFSYEPQTNRYLRNGTTAVSYNRGGTLTGIDYGFRDGATGSAPERVLFDVANRCSTTTNCDTAHPANWPDTPLDQYCASTSPCTGLVTPTFWSSRMITKIHTQLLSGGSYHDVDAWTLSHSFPATGDGTSPALWLRTIGHTGYAGSASITTPNVLLRGVQTQNRVWAVDGLAPLDKYRISSLDNGTGATVTVNYAPPQCTPSNLPASPQSNTMRCFPQWRAPKGSAPKLDWFHKYVVTEVAADPHTGGTGDTALDETFYDYTGTPAWRYDTSPVVPASKRTWSVYAGYSTVRVRHGDENVPGQQQTTSYRFFQGLDGDRAAPAGGTKNVTVPASDGSSVPDSLWLAGGVREQTTYNGNGGARVANTISTPWASGVTADDGTHQARIVGDGTSVTYTALSAGGNRITETKTSHDGYGRTTAVDDLGDSGTAADDACTRTSYASNTSAWLLSYPAEVSVVGRTCAQAPSLPADAISDTRTFYDGSSTLGAAPSHGDATRVDVVSRYTGSTPVWQTTTRTSYDALGRPAAVTDPRTGTDRTTTTSYTPATGPVTGTTVTNPLGWTSTTSINPAWGVPTAVVDPNGHRTDASYDALGRRTQVWLPDRPKAANPSSPSMSYAYTLSTSAPNAVATTRITASGGTATSYALYDGLLRPRQTQAPSEGGWASPLTVETSPIRRGDVRDTTQVR